MKKIKKFITQRRAEKFIDYMARLQPIEFIGLMRFLKIKLVDENDEPIDALLLMVAAAEQFAELPSKLQLDLLKAARDAANAPAPEDGEEQDGTKQH